MLRLTKPSAPKQLVYPSRIGLRFRLASFLQQGTLGCFGIMKGIWVGILLGMFCATPTLPCIPRA